MGKISVGTYLLMFVVVAWGILLGGMFYSNAIVMPVFLGDLPASSAVMNGPFAINEAPFWLTIHPVIIFSIIAALAAHWRDPYRRKMIAIPLIGYVLVIAITAVYFVPELLAFGSSAGSGVSVSEWAGRASRWRILSWVRGGAIVLMIIPLLLALVKDGGARSGNDGRRLED